MHHIEITEPFRYPQELYIKDSQETFEESIIAHKKNDFWKTIIKKHRVGTYLLFKKFQKGKYAFVM